MKKSIVTLFAIAALFTACNDTSKSKTNDATTPTETAALPAEETSNETTLTISGGDDMKFDKAELKAKEGQTVKLILKHSGKAPLTAMGHNVVILAQGVDMAKFATEAINAKDNDYIPKSMEADVIAHTKTIGGGESTEIEFTAPAKGTYDFLCSFPGHSSMMKGKFIVE